MSIERYLQFERVDRNNDGFVKKLFASGILSKGRVQRRGYSKYS